MSIIDSFENSNEAVIKVSDVLTKQSISLSACIINFSHKIMSALIEKKLIELIDEETINSISCNYPIYRYVGTNIGIVKTTVGAPITAGLIEEIGYAFSCRHFVLFGSCGGLDKNIPTSKIIIPTSAYRDEGMSYHYMPVSDYIDIKNHQIIASILDDLGIEYVKGKTWTTDSFYREMRSQVAKRKSEGCIAVEMEVSACEAVADFYGYEFYPFLYRADNLDSFKWDRGVLSLLPIDERLKHFYVALEIAKRIGDYK